MAALEVAHERLHRKNERLASIVDKFKERGKNVTKALVHGGEVMAGAAIAGLIQGSHVPKDANDKGPKIAGVPTDLLLGTALTIGAAVGVAGEEWSPHVGALGLGFMSGFAAEWGYHRGQEKAKTGHWFAKREAAALPAPKAPAAAKAAGEFNPHEMADALLKSRREAQPG